MAGAVAGTTVITGAAPHRQRPPNVLFIICDDLGDHVQGLGGHPQAQTPNLARLMRRGVSFTNAQANAPICGPSRASLWTGLYPHTSGFYGYKEQEYRWRDNPRLQRATTLMEHFRDQGYQVGGTGKVFHNGHEDNSVWSTRGVVSGHGVFPSYGPTPWDGKMPHPPYLGIGHPSLPPPYNRSFWESFGPLSDVPRVPPDPASGAPGHKGWVEFGHPFRYRNDADRDPMPDELHVRWAVERLRQDAGTPFFMVVGLCRPHIPRYAPKQYFDRFPLQTLQLPPYRRHDLDDCARLLWQDPATGKPTPFARALPRLLEAGGEDLWRRLVQSYLACVAFADDVIGQILEALWKGPHAGDTYVVVTSDQGVHLGEKDHLEKNTPWEESLRVPLIVAGPKVATGQTCSRPVSLVDLFPTLTGLCDVARARRRDRTPEVDGHSLAPLLEDPARGRWDGPAVALSSVYGPEDLAPGQPGDRRKQHFTVRSERYRYIRCCNGEEELYDHRSDPHEWQNVAAKPDHSREKDRLLSELRRLTAL